MSDVLLFEPTRISPIKTGLHTFNHTYIHSTEGRGGEGGVCRKEEGKLEY